MTHARVRYDLSFTLALVLSAMTTFVLVLALWRGDSNLRDAGVLWIFTVAGPVIQAIRVHRRLRQLVAASPELSEPILRELREARSALPFFGALALGWALGVGLVG